MVVFEKKPEVDSYLGGEEIDLTQRPSKKVLLKRARKFEQVLLRLQKFVERTGSAYASVLYVEPDGFRLGAWISQQRNEYKKGRLSHDQVAILESLSGWTWHVKDVWWISGFSALKKFVEREGNASVPLRYVGPDGFKLGAWVNNRRAEYRREELSPEQAAALEGMPGWKWRGRGAFVAKPPKPPKPPRIPKLPRIPKMICRKFEDRFFCLQELVARTGSADISVSYVDSDGFRLGRWISSRRTEYHTGRLPKNRIAALEGLPGWRWTGGGSPILKHRPNRGPRNDIE